MLAKSSDNPLTAAWYEQRIASSVADYNASQKKSTHIGELRGIAKGLVRRLTELDAQETSRLVGEVADLVRHRPGDTDGKYANRMAAIHEAATEKDRRDPHMPRRREYLTGAELTKMGIADRREYLRRKDDRLHGSA